MAEQPEADAVRDEPAAHRFVIPIEDGTVGAAYYRRDGENRLVLTHTEVPSEHEGRGIGSALARGVFEIASTRGLRLVLRCPFLSAWYADHPEFADVVEA